jgi:hypothetical protein
MNKLLAQIALGSAVLAAAFGLAACGGDNDSDTVNVSLREYSVGISPQSMSTGNITLEAKNTGATTHEMVVVRAPKTGDVPTKPDGSVDEDKIPESDHVGEIEDIGAGKTVSKSFDLAPGSYVVFCNVVEGAGANVISHYKNGMRTTLTITP